MWGFTLLLVMFAGVYAQYPVCTEADHGNTSATPAELPDIMLEAYNSYYEININPKDGCHNSSRHVGTRLVACDLDEPEVELDSLVHGTVHRTLNPATDAELHVTLYCMPNRRSY